MHSFVLEVQPVSAAMAPCYKGTLYTENNVRSLGSKGYFLIPFENELQKHGFDLYRLSWTWEKRVFWQCSFFNHSSQLYSLSNHQRLLLEEHEWELTCVCFSLRGINSWSYFHMFPKKPKS